MKLDESTRFPGWYQLRGFPGSGPDRRPEGLVFRPSAITNNNLSIVSVRTYPPRDTHVARPAWFSENQKAVAFRSRLRPVDREWPFADAYHIVSEQKAKISERITEREGE